MPVEDPRPLDDERLACELEVMFDAASSVADKLRIAEELNTVRERLAAAKGPRAFEQDLPTADDREGLLRELEEAGLIVLAAADPSSWPEKIAAAAGSWRLEDLPP